MSKIGKTTLPSIHNVHNVNINQNIYELITWQNANRPFLCLHVHL